MGTHNIEENLVFILQSFIGKSRVLSKKKAGYLSCHLTDSSGSFYIVTLSLIAEYLTTNLSKIQMEEFLYDFSLWNGLRFPIHHDIVFYWPL